MRAAFLLLVFFSLNAFASPGIKSDNGVFAFVGEQVKLYEVKPNVGDELISMDLAFKAKYKILEKVYGDYDAPAISFEAYDHYGMPEFSRYKYVLLFLFEHKGNIYHAKYQFFDVYKTKANRWAHCGMPLDYEEGRVEPKPLENIEFNPPLEFTTVIYNEAFAKEKYPEPIFEHVEGKAICRQGVYLDELFRIKKEGLLKNRGYFM